MITTENISALTDGASATPVTPVTPVTPASNPFAVAADAFQKAATTIADTPIEEQIDGAVKGVADQALTIPARDPATGQFVKAEAAPVDPAAPLDPSAPVPEGKPVEGEVEAEAPGEVVTLTDRNGKEIEVEVSDPELAEAIRMTKNNGMRKEEFNRRIAPVEQKEAELRAFEIMLRTAPESVVDTMHPEIRKRTLLHLLASDWEDVYPTLLDWSQNDLARKEYKVDAKEQMSTARQQAQHQITEGTRVATIQRAIESLIPAHASVEEANEFFTAAAAHVGAVDNQRGNALRAEDVAPLLSGYLRRWGFESPLTATATPGSLVPSTPAVATPKGPNAEAIRARAVANTARMKAVPAQQLAVAAIAPPGAGAQAAVKPPILTFDQATDAVRNLYRAQGLK